MNNEIDNIKAYMDSIIFKHLICEDGVIADEGEFNVNIGNGVAGRYSYVNSKE